MTNLDEDLVPISRFFFDDAGPHILSVAVPTPAAAPRFTPARGRELHDLLGASIAQLGGVAGSTRRTPVQRPPVPMDTLLYRGRAALDRALEIRATVRHAGLPLTSETMEELLDLIGLAAEG